MKALLKWLIALLVRLRCIILPLLMIAAAVGLMRVEYMTEREWDAVVLDKSITYGKHDRPSYHILYRLKDSQGILEDDLVFRSTVGESTHRTSRPGETNTIHKRPFDIRQTIGKNLAFFVLPCLLLGMGITLLLVPLLNCCLKDPSDERTPV